MTKFLDLERCPWCNTATPTLGLERHFIEENNNIYVGLYKCTRCFKHIMTNHEIYSGNIVSEYPSEVFPSESFKLDKNIPERARDLLKEAKDTLHSPNYSIMVSASTLDIMLQAIGREKSEGNLSVRIKKAADEHQITEDMANWAHQIRIVANESRHPDENDTSASHEDAKQSLDFLMALAELLFVLPARVEKGIEQTKPPA